MKHPKQVIVWRKDLKVRLGKKMAQAAHASLKVFLELGNTGYAWRTGTDLLFSDEDDPKEHGDDAMLVYLTPEMKTWIENKFTKIVLHCPDEEALLDLYHQARSAGLPCSLVTDAGLTEFKEKCRACDGQGIRLPVINLDADDSCSFCRGKGIVPVPTNTCIAIGPADSEAIDKITGHLGLL